MAEPLTPDQLPIFLRQEEIRVAAGQVNNYMNWVNEIQFNGTAVIAQEMEQGMLYGTGVQAPAEATDQPVQYAAGTLRHYREDRTDGMATNGRDWLPVEVTKNKLEKNKKVKVDKDTIDAIKSICNAIIKDYVKKLKIIYEEKLDKLNQTDYNEIINFFTRDENAEFEDNQEGILYDNMHSFVRGMHGFAHKAIFGRFINANYLALIEQKALEKYDVNYSKYRFYPRSKDKVKYGDADLLSKILIVTNTNQGTLICL